MKSILVLGENDRYWQELEYLLRIPMLFIQDFEQIETAIDGKRVSMIFLRSSGSGSCNSFEALDRLAKKNSIPVINVLDADNDHPDEAGLSITDRILFNANKESWDGLIAKYTDMPDVNTGSENSINYKDEWIREKDFIKYFYSNIVDNNYHNDKVLQSIVSPESHYYGQIMLSQISENGNLYILLCDLNSSGAKSAIGMMSITEVFRKMVNNNHTVNDIVTEIQKHLSTIQTIQFYCGCTLLEVNSNSDRMTVWSGGMPELVLVSSDNIEIIPAQHQAMNADNDSFNSESQSYSLDQSSQILLYTQSFSDLTKKRYNKEANIFLTNITSDQDGNVFEKITDLADSITNDEDQFCLAVINNAELCSEAVDDEQIDLDDILPIELHVTLNAHELKQPDPIGKLVTVIAGMPISATRKGLIYTVMQELYSNALEHSIMGLDSALKSSEQNFMLYYEKRETALASLTDAEITIDITISENKRELIICITDNGSGFQGQSVVTSGEALHGRGINIIKSICNSLTYTNHGKTVTVEMPLD